jgi:hypothetical protein
MPKDNDHRVASLTGTDTSGWLASLLAEEDAFDRRVLWRLGTWAFCAVGALAAAVLTAQSSTSLRGERTASAELTRQAQQIQWIAKESQNETRRLSAAVDTLNNDRDRLYSRVTVVEQSLDSVTGSIGKQANASPPPSASTPAPPSSPPPPMTSRVAVTDPGIASDKTSDYKPEQKAESKTDVKDVKSDIAAMTTAMTAALPSAKPAAKTDIKDAGKNADVMASAAALSDMREIAAAKPVQRTDFGVDIGTANSVEGLRALWRGALGSQNALLGGLQPIIVVKERTDGFGLQLRLVAGPLADAATAAKICARLAAGKHECATSVYDGQRLALGSEPASPHPVATAPKPRRNSRGKPQETPAPAAQNGFSALFGAR